MTPEVEAAVVRVAALVVGALRETGGVARASDFERRVITQYVTGAWGEHMVNETAIAVARARVRATSVDPVDAVAVATRAAATDVADLIVRMFVNEMAAACALLADQTTVLAGNHHVPTDDALIATTRLVIGRG